MNIALVDGYQNKHTSQNKYWELKKNEKYYDMGGGLPPAPRAGDDSYRGVVQRPGGGTAPVGS